MWLSDCSTAEPSNTRAAGTQDPQVLLDKPSSSATVLSLAPFWSLKTPKQTSAGCILMLQLQISFEWMTHPLCCSSADGVQCCIEPGQPIPHPIYCTCYLRRSTHKPSQKEPAASVQPKQTMRDLNGKIPPSLKRTLHSCRVHGSVIFA